MDFNVFTMISVAIAFGCAIPIVAIYYGAKEKELEANEGSGKLREELEATKAEVALSAEKLEAMATRLAVLERLAMDEDAALDKKFDRLKREDERSVAG